MIDLFDSKAIIDLLRKSKFVVRSCSADYGYIEVNALGGMVERLPTGAFTMDMHITIYAPNIESLMEKKKILEDALSRNSRKFDFEKG